MTLHKAIAAAVLTLVGLSIAVMFYARSIDFDRYRGGLVQELRDATGREVSIAGPIELAFGLDSAFIIKGVRIANAPWGSRAELAKVRTVEAHFRLLPLLAGRVRIDRLRLIQPDIWLETDPVGKVNWILAAAPDGRAQPTDGPAPPNQPLLGMLGVDGLDVVGGRITYRDGATGDIDVLALEQASVVGDGHSKPLALAVQGSWNGLPMSVRGTLGPLGDILRGATAAYPVDATMTVAGVQIETTGTVGNPHDGPGVALTFSARADTLQGLAPVIGTAAGKMRRMSLAASVAYRGNRLDITEVRFGIGDSSISGTAHVDFGPSSPVFEIDLTAPRLDLSALTGGPTDDAAVTVPTPANNQQELDGAPTPAGGRWRLDGLRAANGTARLRAEVVQFGGVSLQSVALDLRLQDGELVVAPLRARLLESDLDGEARVDARAEPPSATLTLKTSSIAVGSLLQKLDGIRAFDGTLVATVRLQSSGASVGDMLTGLEGEALLAMGRARLSLEPQTVPPSGLAAPGMAGLVGMLIAEDAREVAINCAAIPIVMRDAVVTSTGVVFDSDHARVRGEGRADLRDQRVALRLVPQSKGPRLALSAPVSVGGPWHQPVLAVESEAAGREGRPAARRSPLRSFLERFWRGESANACLRAVPQRAERPRKTRRSRKAREQVGGRAEPAKPAERAPVRPKSAEEPEPAE